MRNILRCTTESLKLLPLPTVVLILGALVRIIAWGTLPPGLNQDEASIGYETFTIAHYGIDRNGERLPVHLIAWGSGQNALYAYLSVPFVLLFGLNVYSVRLAALLLGIAGMFALYAITKRMLPDGNGPLYAALLIAVSPWHFMMSRWALESNAFPTIVLLAFVCLLKGLERPRWLFGFTALMALSMYAYGTAYFFVPVFMVCAAFLLWRHGKLKLLTGAWHVGLMLLLSLPIMLFVFINRYDGEAVQTGWFTIPKLSAPRVEEVSSLFDGSIAAGLLERIARFSELMISGHDGLLWNAVPGFGYLYPISLPFILIGFGFAVYKAFKLRALAFALLLIWLGAAVLTALIVQININRINIIFYPIVLLAAFGLYALSKRYRLAAAVSAVAFVVYFGLFSSYYYTDYGGKIGPMFYESFDKAVVYASDATDGTVYVTDQVNMPYIYVLFYERIDPKEYQSTVEYRNPGGAFQQVQSFGRYVFGQPAPQPGKHAAYIVRNGDPMLANTDGFEVRSFKHFSVLSGEGALPSLHRGFMNGGFETGEIGWSFMPGSGIGTNRPLEGSNLLYLDPGFEITVYQTFIAEETGWYQLTGHTSASGEGGRIVVKVNDEIRAEADIPAFESYSELILPVVYAELEEIVTVSISGGTGWVNIDSIEWISVR